MQHTFRRVVFVLLFSLAILPPLYIQTNYIGKLSTSVLHYHWLTASTMKFVDNWLEDGIVTDRFMMLELPRSIEYPTANTRKYYSSYLPGAVLEIFLFKKLFPQVETLVVIQIFNIINQFIISCLLMMFVWLGLAAFPILRTWFALIAFVSYQLLPQTTFIHSMIFFADIAVLVPLLIVLLMELLLRADDSQKNWPKFFINLHQQKQTWLKLIQTIALTWAVMCDWVAIPLLFILLGLRFLTPIDNKKSYFKDSLQLLMLPLSVVTLFLLQLYSIDEIPHLWDRFIHRSGQGARVIIFFYYLIPRFFIDQLGSIISALIFLGSIFVCWQFVVQIRSKQPSAFLVVLSIFMFTCYSHLFILPNHSLMHVHFSITKFLLLTILLLLCYLSCLLMAQILKLNKPKQMLASLVSVLGFLFVWQTILNFVSINSDNSFSYNLHLEHQAIAQWLRDNAKYEDVYFGKSLSINDSPPMNIAWSRKAVHSFASDIALKQFINKLPSNANYYVILSDNELRKCHLTQVKAQSRIYDQYQYWSIIPFSFDQTLTVHCLVDKWSS